MSARGSAFMAGAHLAHDAGRAQEAFVAALAGLALAVLNHGTASVDADYARAHARGSRARLVAALAARRSSATGSGSAS